MKILENKAELLALFERHQSKVKDKYKSTSLDTFVAAYYDKLSSDNDDEMYIELSKSETVSGHSEILDW